ncbi:MAG TPA: hypothetical protein VEA99_12795 [Gemmatimonadaceae bacterium]|nr:hypothetical protein [Gemmatimonadaceae bacterium]
MVGDGGSPERPAIQIVATTTARDHLAVCGALDAAPLTTRCNDPHGNESMTPDRVAE